MSTTSTTTKSMSSPIKRPRASRLPTSIPIILEFTPGAGMGVVTQTLAPFIDEILAEQARARAKTEAEESP